MNKFFAAFLFAGVSTTAMAGDHAIKICRQGRIVDVFTGKKIPFKQGQTFINSGSTSDSVLVLQSDVSISAKAKCATVGVTMDQTYTREPSKGELYLLQDTKSPSPNVTATVVK